MRPHEVTPCPRDRSPGRDEVAPPPRRRRRPRRAGRCPTGAAPRRGSRPRTGRSPRRAPACSCSPYAVSPSRKACTRQASLVSRSTAPSGSSATWSWCHWAAGISLPDGRDGLRQHGVGQAVDRAPHVGQADLLRRPELDPAARGRRQQLAAEAQARAPACRARRHPPGARARRRSQAATSSSLAPIAPPSASRPCTPSGTARGTASPKQAWTTSTRMPSSSSHSPTSRGGSVGSFWIARTTGCGSTHNRGR